MKRRFCPRCPPIGWATSISARWCWGISTSYRIRPISRENTSGSWERAVAQGRRLHATGDSQNAPSHYVAQPLAEGAPTVCFANGQRVEHPQDHIVFAVRNGRNFDVLPGALTRVYSRDDPHGEFGFGWTSKDSWVLNDERRQGANSRARTGEPPIPAWPSARSRAAWRNRFTGWAAISSARTTRLISSRSSRRSKPRNSTPPSGSPIARCGTACCRRWKKAPALRRRSIANRLDRYRLVLAPEPGTVVSTFLRAMYNAESVQDSLSPEAWAALSEFRSRFQRTPLSRWTQRAGRRAASRAAFADSATQLIPQFFAVADNTMLADDGWRFCEIGQSLERAIITANSALSISKTLAAHAGQSAVARQRRSNSAPFCACSAAATPTGASSRCAPSRSPCSNCSGSIPRCRAACFAA